MTYTIDQLKSKLTPKENLEDTWRYPNCYAEANGKVIGLNYTQQEDITALVLDDAASDLQFLYLSYNKNLQQVDIQVSLPQLTHLYLNNCNIRHFELSQSCPALKHLYLEQQGFAEKKYDNKDTGKLETLQLNGRHCPNLWFLELSNNNLKRLQFEGSFPELAYIYAGFNGMETLTMPYQSVPKLNILDLQENRLGELPLGIENLTNLEVLTLKENPLPNIDEIYKKGDGSGNAIQSNIIAYLKSLQQGKIINNHARIILIGNGSAGKTTLSHQFRNNEFIEISEKDRTHGILIEEWKIPFADCPQNLKDKITETINNSQDETIDYPEEITLSLWDFGGQEYYHATHRLFLNNNVVYLLLWEDSSNYEDETNGLFPLQHWQENINYYAPDTKKALTVQNKVRGAYQCDPQSLQYKVNFRDKSNSQSVQQYDIDVSTLRTITLEQLAELSTLGTPFPKVYEDIRIALSGIDKPILFFEDYVKFCKENDNSQDKIMQDDAQIKALTTFLHETGAIICYQYQEAPIINRDLKKYVFTKPKWVTSVIYDILGVDLEKSNSEFDETYLQKALYSSKTYQEENQSYLEELSLDWILLMKQFELIFEIEKKGKIRYVAPQYLAKECSSDLYDNIELFLENRKMELSFILKFPKYIPNSLFLRFIAKYGRQSKPNFYYWKKGIAFFSESKENKKVAFVEQQKIGEDYLIKVEVQDNDSELSKEIFSFFEAKCNENTLISKDGKHYEKLQEVLKYKEHYFSNFGFLFEKEEIFNESNIKNMTIKDVNDAIASNQIEKALNILDNLIPSENASILIGLKNQHKKFKSDKILGLLSFREESQQQNIIVNGVLELCSLIEMSSSGNIINDTPSIIKPTILMAFAANDLDGVEHEAEKIYNAVKSSSLTVHKKVENVDIEKLADAIIDSDNLFMFHFGGHADQGNIVLDGFKNLDKTRLSRLLLPNNDHNMQLIFLNGCLSYGHVGILTAKDVKAIIATNVSVLDKEALSIASRFYKLFFEKKYTLKNAFETAEATVNGKNSFITVVNPGEIDENQAMPSSWTLFINSRYKEVMDWKLEDFIKQVNK